MSLPSGNVKNITTTDGVTHEIIPERLKNGSYEAVLPTLATDSTIALTSDLSSYLPLSGGTMTGNLTFANGAKYINLRNGHDSYDGGMYYNTPGNEALIFACKNPVTSWIFEAGLSCTSTGTSWQTFDGASGHPAVPSLQIKNQQVAINKLIANGTSLSYTLDVNGSINATNIYASSDERLKENIKTVELDCSKIIKDLEIKEFNFKSDKDKKLIVGAIAQQLRNILPDKYKDSFVLGNENDYYSINEGKLLYIAIGALKDEMQKTKELEERIKKLEEK